jgi:hypothetical protein
MRCNIDDQARPRMVARLTIRAGSKKASTELISTHN